MVGPLKSGKSTLLNAISGSYVSEVTTLPAYADLVPYVILLVELDEGVRMVGYLVDDAGEVLKTDGEAEGIRIGTRVSLRFHDQAGTLLPSWTPVVRI